MLTLTCRTTGQPIPLRSDRFSGAVPLPDAPGCRVRSIDGEVFVAVESTSEIAAMLQPAPGPAVTTVSAPDRNAAAKQAATLLRRMADILPSGVGLHFTINDAIGLSGGADPSETALVLTILAIRLES